MSNRVKVIWVLVLLSLCALVALAPGASALQGQQIEHFKFHPADMRVSPGETIRVVNFDGRLFGIPHSLTSNQGHFDTGVFFNGHRDVVAPTTPGKYRFFCKVHTFMHGTLYVS